jgi:hypothetical protein
MFVFIGLRLPLSGTTYSDAPFMTMGTLVDKRPTAEKALHCRPGMYALVSQKVFGSNPDC